LTAYLVTGCAGFIGSRLAEALLDAGETVVGVDAFTDYYARELKEANVERLVAQPAFTLVRGDLVEEPLAPLVARCDGVFHVAAQPGVRGSWGDSFGSYARANLLATQRVLEAAASAGVRVVLASSSSVYGEAERYPTHEDTPPRPISPYGVTKLGCEHLARAYASVRALDAVVIRYFTVYGPGQRPDMAFARIIRALVTAEPFHVYGSGDQSRDVTYVDDAVDATVRAMERAPAGAVYNVGGGTETSLLEVIALVEELTGRRLDTRLAPAAAGDVRRTAADTTRIRAALGWEPATSLEDGLSAQLAWAAGTVAPR
jgi:nucleoside-diphosphate-sugar epimerase